MCHVVGGEVYLGLLYFPTAENPADDPTRDAPLRAPVEAWPKWAEAAVRGDFAPMDEFLQKHGVDPEQLKGVPKLEIKSEESPPHGPARLGTGFGSHQSVTGKSERLELNAAAAPKKEAEEAEEELDTEPREATVAVPMERTAAARARAAAGGGAVPLPKEAAVCEEPAPLQKKAAAGEEAAPEAAPLQKEAAAPLQKRAAAVEEAATLQKRAAAVEEAAPLQKRAAAVEEAAPLQKRAAAVEAPLQKRAASVEKAAPLQKRATAVEEAAPLQKQVTTELAAETRNKQLDKRTKLGKRHAPKDCIGGVLSPEAQKCIYRFREDQFVWPKRSYLPKGELRKRQGFLDLYSGSLGVAREVAQLSGCWVLTFDYARDTAEDLLQAATAFPRG